MCESTSSGGLFMKKTLYVSDLDGTLLSPAPEITEHTAEVINALTAKGEYFTFATARSIYSAIPITGRLDINVPCILMNGVSIYDIRNKRYLKTEFIPVEASAEVLKAFERNNVRCFMYKLEDETLVCYYSELNTKVMRSFAESRKNDYKKPFVQVDRLADHANGDAIYYTTTGPHDVLYPVKCAVEKIEGVDYAFYLDVYNGEWYLEVFSAKASKFNGIKFLREEFGFDEVVAFGDNLNDLSMFEAADVKIAVGNAKDELKAAADIVIGCNDGDGVAEWLSSAVMNNR